MQKSKNNELRQKITCSYKKKRVLIGVPVKLTKYDHTHDISLRNTRLNSTLKDIPRVLCVSRTYDTY